MSIRAYLFDADGRDREVDLSQDVTEALTDRQLLWVDITGPDEAELRAVQALLRLHRESVKNLLNPIGRPRLDHYDEYFQINVVAVTETDGRYAPLALDLFSGPNYVVTVHPEPITFLDDFIAHVRGDTQIGQLTAAAFLASVLDWHVTSYFRVLDGLEAEVDRLDDSALQQPVGRHFLVELSALRRGVAAVRRLLAPHREVFAALARPDFEAIATSESSAHFRALNDRLERAIETTENTREMVIGSFEVFMTGTAQNTNDIVKRLTLVTLLVGFVGVIAGVMGMNFELAFYASGARGFFIVVAVMLVLVGGTLVLACRRRWL